MREALTRSLANQPIAELKMAESTGKLWELLNERVPDVLIAPLPEAPSQLQRLVRWLGGPGAHTRSVLIGGPVQPEQTGLFQKLPNCQVLPASPRLEFQLFDVLERALRAKPRIQVRSELSLAGELEEEGKGPQKVVLVDISESGARLQVQRALEVGMPVMLRLHWNERLVEAECLPMRNEVSPTGERFSGVQFESVSETLVELLRTLDRGAGKGRRARRFLPQPSLAVKLRVRPEGAKATHYLSLRDLSMIGVSGTLPKDLPSPLSPGQRAELTVLWKGKSLKASAEMVRPPDPQPQGVIGFRFLSLSREDTFKLRALIDTLAHHHPERASRA
jgi:hypothetical protein